jgi:predicted NBD/HSP70 family sugar kinase
VISRCQDQVGKWQLGGSSAISGSPPLLRQINQARVLTVLRQAGGVRLGQLAQLTGLSRQTVSPILDGLDAAGWVTYLDEHPGGRTGLGRPARIVQFRAEAGYVVGIDIGPHRTHAVVADLEGKLTASSWHVTSNAQDSRQLLSTVRATVRNALGRAGVERQKVMSVAVGTPGIIDRETGAVVRAPGLPGWTSINLTRELRRSFRCPIQIENDINLAVLGECWHGVSRDAQTVVFVGWGERVGAGICIGGRLHPGASNAAGEIGYLGVLNPDDPRAEADEEGRGPFERGVGASAIIAMARDATRLRHGLTPAVADVTAPAVFAAARDGDPTAQEIVDTVLARLARGLAPLLLILDPDMLVIGGGLSQAGSPMLKTLENHLRGLTLIPAKLELSALGEDAVAHGAIRMALTDVEQRLMPTVGAYLESPG